MSSLGELKCSIQRVTAVKLVKSLTNNQSLHLFTGAGSKVHLQELISDEWVSLYHQVVLKGAVIYGFCIGPEKHIAVFGQKAVVICQFDTDHRMKVVSPLRRLDDWICDLQWLDTDEQQTLQYAVITAHNRLLCCDVKGNLIDCYLSDVNCILYSAKILPSACRRPAKDGGELAVVAGTVFNTVILWTADSLACKSPLTHSLYGHKGVIFDIDVHMDNRLMCSVSDDRSIHLWRWKYDSCKEKTWSNVEFDLLAVLNGHTCRVWSAVVLDSRRIISIGEDGYVIVWDEHGLIKRRLRSHNSGSVWSISVSSHHMVTTGANGSVWMWRLDSLLEDNLEEISAQSPVSIEGQADFPRVVEVQAHCCFVLTDKGCLYGYNLLKCSTKLLEGGASWSLIATTDASNGLTFIALGTTFGLIRLLLIDRFLVIQGLTEFEASEEKLLKLQWVRDTHQLLVSISNGTVLKYEVEGTGSMNISVSERNRYSLPKQKQWFPACSCQLTGEAGAHYLVLADMDGSIHLYRIEEEARSLAQPQMTLYRVHGKKGLTDMYSYGNILHTIGRDGHYHKYSLSSAKLLMLDSVKISTEFNWLARFIPDNDDSGVKLVAFHTTEIILYDVTLNYAILRVNCGGGHRSWDFTQYAQAFYVVFIRAKSVQIFKKSCNTSFVELTPSFHIGKVTCGHLLSTDSQAILITGGDDGCVMASAIDETGSNLLSASRKSTHVYSHISSIKCMRCAYSLSQPDTLMVFTGGGRAQLVAAKLRIAEAKVKTLSVCSTFLSRGPSKKEKISMDNRVMAITSVPLTTDRHLLLLACSDGCIRLAVYNDETEHLCVGSTRLYEHSHCLLSLHSCSGTGNPLLLAVSATDGAIILLNLSPDLIQNQLLCSFPSAQTCQLQPSVSVCPLLTIQSHQSGVNALTSSCLFGSKLTLYSGGDDNSVVVSEIDTHERKMLCQQVYSQQHAAQITGIALYGDRLITCSVDQRLHIWCKKSSLSGWNLCGSMFIDIADIACLTSHGEMVAVCGQGVEVLQNL
ncbi:tRNA (34-2'-O)-methyltransferase regulator WDR6-like isoform X2 [Watersipora subatra]|uniref:tRNA (34-2'-O)-methyltransferase regulator WDR6-like isoform X2 n=1 Tax=Watersipora subatra TaxID=2589382 RepID=UPI00355B64F4